MPDHLYDDSRKYTWTFSKWTHTARLSPAPPHIVKWLSVVLIALAFIVGVSARAHPAIAGLEITSVEKKNVAGPGHQAPELWLKRVDGRLDDVLDVQQDSPAAQHAAFARAPYPRVSHPFLIGPSGFLFTAAAAGASPRGPPLG